MKKTKKIVMTALFTAMIAVLTMFPKIPVPAGGYIHLGDSLIIAAVYFLGILSIPAAAIGSALADIISGYAVYAPATFVIKALMALVAYIVIGKKDNITGFIIASVFAELVMMTGYFLFDTILYGIAGALPTLLYSFMQASGGIIIGVAICVLSKKAGLKEKYFIDENDVIKF